MNFYNVTQCREQIGKNSIEAVGPAGVISVSKGRYAGGLVAFGLTHASQGNKLVDENRSPLSL